MKKHKIIMAVICLLTVLSLALAFTGCSDKLSFKKFVKFKEEAVEKVEIMSEYNVVKQVAVAEVFAAFGDVNFIKTEQAKYESDWDINRLMTVNFYLKDKVGYYSIVINTGARARDGYDYKSTVGFYNIENSTDLITKLNKLFYAK